jgi:DNA-binding NtrC family response regulator
MVAPFRRHQRSTERHWVTSSLLPRILVIDDDRDMGEVVTAVLGDEGYQVTVLEHISDETVRAAIGSLEPDCILLGRQRTARS